MNAIQSALLCILLQGRALHHYTILHNNWQYSTTFDNIGQYWALFRNIGQISTIYYSIGQYSKVLGNIPQYCAKLYLHCTVGSWALGEIKDYDEKTAVQLHWSVSAFHNSIKHTCDMCHVTCMWHVPCHMWHMWQMRFS